MIHLFQVCKQEKNPKYCLGQPTCSKTIKRGINKFSILVLERYRRGDGSGGDTDIKGGPSLLKYV